MADVSEHLLKFGDSYSRALQLDSPCSTVHMHQVINYVKNVSDAFRNCTLHGGERDFNLSKASTPRTDAHAVTGVTGCRGLVSLVEHNQCHDFNFRARVSMIYMISEYRLVVGIGQ